MKRRFVVADPEKCTGCRLCEMVCSAVKEGEFNPLLSRIRTVQLDVVVSTSLACRLCENPTCVRSCPRKALSVDEKTGTILVDEEKCSGCGWCIEACEFGVLALHPEKKVVVVCDLCDGEPKCVEFCPKDALELRTTEEVAQKSRSEAVRKLLTEES
jgi:Fe-S-cluster-containing dehydrogenase component